MPHGVVIAEMPAPAAIVFALLHDYDRRLQWDSLLKEARLQKPWTQAELHAISLCRGRTLLGGFALETQYISFDPPQVAAVKLVNRPPFFETFAASIRHQDLSEGRSRIEYKYHFSARPKWLRRLLHPLMNSLFRYETHKRLQALSRFLARQTN